MRILFIFVLLATGCITDTNGCENIEEFRQRATCIQESRDRSEESHHNDAALISALQDSASMAGTLEGQRAEAPGLFSKSTAASCCKVCRTGKACGDSCIAQYKTCHKAPGCACDE